MVFFRRQRWVWFSLSLVLVVLLLGKVIFPKYLRAQSAPAAPATNTVTSDGSQPVPACTEKTNIDVVNYIAPKCDGKQCPSIESTATIDGVAQNVSNQVVWVNDNTFKQESGDIHFLYQVNGSVINFLQDTIWAPPPFYCENTKNEAFYRVFNTEDGSWGGKIANSSMSCGEKIVSNQFIKAYQKLPEIETNPLMNVDNRQCNVPGQSGIPTSVTKQLIFQGPAMCNNKKTDEANNPLQIAVFVNVAGAGVNEVYVYCKGYGLCGFYNKLDFSDPTNQPANWTAKTDVCNLKSTPKSQNTSYFEYNIQRKSSTKILNNFYDEYSVSCLPKAAYTLVTSNKEKCDKVAGGCNNWNLTGGLTMNAQGKLFGLFRDEKKVEARIDSANSANTKTTPTTNTCKNGLGSSSTGNSSSSPLTAETFTSNQGGWIIKAPTDPKNLFVTANVPSGGQNTCTFAGSVGAGSNDFSINANFGNGPSSPLGPFGSGGNIKNVPPNLAAGPMSLVVDKDGNAKIYDWTGITQCINPEKSDNNDNKDSNGNCVANYTDSTDIVGPPDLTNASFVVTGVYYNDFNDPQGTKNSFTGYRGLTPRTAIGISGNNLYVVVFKYATPKMVADTMLQQLGINPGHFVMLDGDTSTQLCQGTSSLNGNNANVSVNMTIKSANSSASGSNSGSGQSCTPNAQSSDTSRFDSLEAYLSTRVTDQPSARSAPINSSNPASLSDFNLKQSPLYKLKTLEQQCQMIVDKLIAVNELCTNNRIEGEENAPCALDSQIPGYTDTHIALLNKIQSSGKKCVDDTNGVGLMHPDVSDATGQTLKSEILSVNPAMDVAYRPAFIVAVTQFNGTDEKKNPAFYSPKQKDAQRFAVVDYMEVKVPAFGSDFVEPGEKHSADQINNQRNGYRDPLLATVDAINSSDAQASFRKKEQQRREEIRQHGTLYGKSVIPPLDPENMYCRVGSTLVDCKHSLSNPNFLPEALIQFINANGVTCDTTLKDFYDKLGKDKIVEKVKKIGAFLEAKDQTGIYIKQKTLNTEMQVSLDMKPTTGSLGDIGDENHTQFYFVSPHQYNLDYAQQSFYNFLTLDQQKGSKAKAFLNTGDFSPAMQGDLNENLNNGQTTRTGTETVNSNQTPASTPQPVTVSAEFDFKGTDRQSLFWDFAGRVASLPTRLVTLLVTLPNEAAHITTLNCKGNYATENWFLHNCGNTDTNPGSNTPSKSSGNYSSVVDGSIDPNQTFSETGDKSSTCIQVRESHDQALADGEFLKKQLDKPIAQACWAFNDYKPGGKQYLYTDCGLGSSRCYADIIDKAVENNINPYLAIGIAFNESGGLKTDTADGTGPFFGCGIASTYVQGDASSLRVTYETIPAKLNCMINTLKKFTDPDQYNLDSNQALWHYGYTNGCYYLPLNQEIEQLQTSAYANYKKNANGTTSTIPDCTEPMSAAAKATQQGGQPPAQSTSPTQTTPVDTRNQTNSL